MFPDGSVDTDPFDGQFPLTGTFNDTDLLDSSTNPILMDTSVKQEPQISPVAHNNFCIKQELSLEEQLSLVTQTISADTSISPSLNQTPNTSFSRLSTEILADQSINQPPLVNISHPSSVQLQQVALKLRQAQLDAQKKQQLLLQLQQRQQKQQQAQLLQRHLKLILQQASAVQQQKIQPQPQVVVQPTIQKITQAPVSIPQPATTNVGLNLQQLQQVSARECRNFYCLTTKNCHWISSL